MYRVTRKYQQQQARQRAAQRTREANRMAAPAPDYPAVLPELRMRITVERLDFGREAHVFELHKTSRVDVFRCHSTRVSQGERTGHQPP